ncbi:MAG: TrkH family potassium uptake protein [Kiritimatiellae bacterium]|nr:TrkH family potassium uptake protein [Kiritimatiellia bacterium]
MLAPLFVALRCGDTRTALAFAIPAAAGIVGGAVAAYYSRRNKLETLGIGSAFTAVGGSWVSACVFGSIPFLISGAIPSITDAIFESISGFTTTGATIFVEVENLPPAINLWRCETHWLGGMGVIVLVVALIPLLGIGGFRLVKAETTGPEKGKFTARIANTAKALWLVYFAFTAMQASLLRLCGMGWFDAVCHAFSTLGTGGFSTRNGSIASFGLPAAEWFCTVFMLLASVNFAIYCRLLSGRRPSEILRDSELRTFAGIAGGAMLLAFLGHGTEGAGVAAALRGSAFQVASILSTTGFMTEDYIQWRPFAQMVIFVLFLVGGCSGSTAGGIKIVRWTLLAKQLANEVRRLLHPRAVYTVRLDGHPGREDLVPLAATFIFAYVMLVLITALVGALGGLDPLSALTGALSMVGNVGPAFGKLGPTANYGFLPAPIKCWYCFAMLAGRLEIYTMALLAARALRGVVGVFVRASHGGQGAERNKA